MTALNASTVPLAVRIKNSRYDGLVTGYLVGDVQFVKTDPGGYRSASFTVSSRLGFRSDMVAAYSRVYFYNKRNGDTVFEGDVSHPGRSVGDTGELLEVNVEGGVARLSDWSGGRIFVDRDMTAYKKRDDSVTAATMEVSDDRGGSGDDALTLSFPSGFTVQQNWRINAGYWRIRECGQQLGRVNYSWDAGLTNANWLARLVVSPGSVVARSQSLSTAGSGGSGAVVGGAIPVGLDVFYLQLAWVHPTSPTTTSATLDNTWVGLLDPVVVARLHLKDGTFKSSGYTDSVSAVDVWEDMLGDPNVLASAFDAPNAVLDAGTGFQINQLAYPDGCTPLQVADDLMKFEPSCTYIVGPSAPGIDKYTLKWMSRTDVPRYEFITWTDGYSAGAQAVDQYDVAVSRWRTPNGTARFTTTTQSIPEMAAAGRTRRYFQDLGDETSNNANATQANSSVLSDHRFPQNGGRVAVAREVVDLYTGRRVQPYEIEPGYICRIVGVNPSRDALNNNPRNGSTLCRIVSTSYSASSHSVDCELDSEPWSMFRAIANAGKGRTNRPGRYPSR
jgi:hypothetical protein